MEGDLKLTLHGPDIVLWHATGIIGVVDWA